MIMAPTRLPNQNRESPTCPYVTDSFDLLSVVSLYCLYCPWSDSYTNRLASDGTGADWLKLAALSTVLDIGAGTGGV